MIVLIVKQYIYRTRCLKGKLSIQETIFEIDKIRKIEVIIARKKNKTTQHECKWQGIRYNPRTQKEMQDDIVDEYLFSIGQ